MTLEAPIRCSALAEELDESMIGSVEMRRRWLLVEDRSAWGEKAVRDVLGAPFEAAAKERAVRVLLIRRREGDPADDGERRVILVDTVARRMVQRTIHDPADLSIAAVADLPLDEFGRPLDGPVFLVCTNGKRDACCALRGRVLMSALATDHAESTWECSHIGGHRFAANLVCLPDGIVYGRVSPVAGPRLASAYVDGRLDPSSLRGRSAWPAPAQVAEQELRRRLRLDGIGDVTLVAVEAGGDEAVVTLAAPDGAAHRYEMVAERLAPRRISCRADELEEPLHWRVSAGAE